MLAVAVIACVCAAASALDPFASAIRSMTLTPNQRAYVSALKDDRIEVLVASGPAGTGKTSLAVLHALSALRSGARRRLILTRPTVLVDEVGFGALPGNMVSKITPLVQHIAAIIGDTPGCTSSVHSLAKEKGIEIIPLEYIRGHTFDDAIVVCDEAQNATPRQVKALLTRIGQRSKILMCGDMSQCDLDGVSGMKDFVDRLGRTDSEEIVHVKLDRDDVCRSEAVKRILRVYDEPLRTERSYNCLW